MGIGFIDFHIPSFPRPASITSNSRAAIFAVASVQSCSKSMPSLWKRNDLAERMPTSTRTDCLRERVANALLEYRFYFLPVFNSSREVPIREPIVVIPVRRDHSARRTFSHSPRSQNKYPNVQQGSGPSRFTNRGVKIADCKPGV